MVSFISSTPPIDIIIEKYIDLFLTVIKQNVKYLFDPEYIFIDEEYENRVPDVFTDDFRYEPYQAQVSFLSFAMTTYWIKKLLGKNYELIRPSYRLRLNEYLSNCSYTIRNEEFIKSRIVLYIKDYKEYLKDPNYLRPLTIHAIYFKPTHGEITIDSCFMNRDNNVSYSENLLRYNIKLRSFEKSLHESLKYMCDSLLNELREINRFIE